MSNCDVCVCWQQIRCSAPLSFLSHSQFLRVLRNAPFLIWSVIPLLLLTGVHLPQTVHAGSNYYTVSPYTLASCDTLQCASGLSGWTNQSVVNFFPVRTAPDDLQIWDVYYSNTYKIVEIPSTGEQFVLYQCGTAQPAVGNVSVQYIQLSANGQQTTGNLTVEIRPDAKIFKIPLQKVCVLGTDAMTYLELLGVRSKIYAIAVDYMTSPCLQLAVQNQQIIAFPAGTYSLTAAQEAPCDAVVNAGNGAYPDPKAITFPATSDQSLLDRAEYLEYLALFFNREAVANSLISGIRSRFTAFAALAQQQTVSPISAWISSYNSASFGSSYYFDTTPYKIELLTKAGTIPYIPASATAFSTPQAVMAALLKGGVQWLIDETYELPPGDNYTSFGQNWALSAADLNPATSRYAFIRNQQVWRDDRLINRNAADDWFEDAIPNVDAVLYDFVTAVFPAIDPTYTQIWLRNIAKGQGVHTNIILCDNTAYAEVPLMTNPNTLTSAQFGGCPSWYTDPRLYSANNAGGSGGINSALTAKPKWWLVLLLASLLTAVLYTAAHASLQ